MSGVETLNVRGSHRKRNSLHLAVCALCCEASQVLSRTENTVMDVVTVFLAVTRYQVGNPQRGRVCFSLRLQRF